MICVLGAISDSSAYFIAELIIHLFNKYKTDNNIKSILTKNMHILFQYLDCTALLLLLLGSMTTGSTLGISDASLIARCTATAATCYSACYFALYSTNNICDFFFF